MTAVSDLMQILFHFVRYREMHFIDGGQAGRLAFFRDIVVVGEKIFFKEERMYLRVWVVHVGDGAYLSVTVNGYVVHCGMSFQEIGAVSQSLCRTAVEVRPEADQHATDERQ